MKNSKRWNKYFILAGMAGATAYSGCSRSARQYAETRGMNGFINMDAVKEAFQKYPQVNEFEKRVNEIFEGDNLIIFESSSTNYGFIYNAYEDLDKSKKVDEKDDKIFALKVEWDTVTLQGFGVNNYFNETWPYTPPKEEKEKDYTHHDRYRHRPTFFYWYFGRGWRGYYTPRDRYAGITAHRNKYRQSGDYSRQIKSNGKFEDNMSKQYGANFRKSANRVSNTRSTHLKATGRSASRGSYSRGRGFGGHRGSSGFGVA